MGLRTAIYPLHLTSNAKMVDFGGWDMPIHYGSQLEEHHLVRSSVGVCDVSHMTVIDLNGPDAKAYLLNLLPNDVNKLDRDGRALYSAMLNEAGGVLDDLIVYRDGDGFRIVVNCATREKDLQWMTQQTAGFDCTLMERSELSILAIQGPESLDRIQEILREHDKAVEADYVAGLKPFIGGWCGDWFLARTGYTGEKGVEIILPAADAFALWEQLIKAGVAPIGLGARDTLRLEAGMNLYGSDMDETVTPFESNMDITVVLDEARDFIGKEKLAQQAIEGVERELVGLVMLGRGVIRAHYPIYSGEELIGEVTSGAFSPTLQHAIALARVQTGKENLEVEIRGKRHPVEKVQPPFARNGKKAYKI
jgi:aminomethyltransferase